MSGLEELDWPVQSPDLNPTKHLSEIKWNSSCDPDPICPTSVSDLTDARVPKWEWIPGIMFHHLVENLPRKLEAERRPSSQAHGFEINKHIWGCCLDVHILLTIYLCSHMTKHLSYPEPLSTFLNLLKKSIQCQITVCPQNIIQFHRQLRCLYIGLQNHNGLIWRSVCFIIISWGTQRH